MEKIPVINQVIKDKRKELKITQEDFTKIINKGISTVRRYDTGDIIPENTLILICDKLNLNFYDLLKKQELENKRLQLKNYEKLINKNEGNLLFYGLKEMIDEKKEKEEEKRNNLTYSFNQLYSILYDEFYWNLGKINKKESLKNKKYFTEIDLKEEKILVKEIKTFINDEKEEKYIDIFSIDNYENFLKELKDYFNVKLAIMRKEKLK